MREIEVSQLQCNPMTMIANEWMLLAAGTREGGYNAMTCSWGHLGSLWGHGGGRPTAVCYVRPQRYTKEFLDREELYTLSFFTGFRKEMAYIGSHSGREEDKIAACGLTPVFGEGYTGFAQARLTLVCRKLYRAPLVEEGFVHPELVEDNYPQRDFHDMYIGEIIRVLVAD